MGINEVGQYANACNVQKPSVRGLMGGIPMESQCLGVPIEGPRVPLVVQVDDLKAQVQKLFEHFSQTLDEKERRIQRLESLVG